MGSSFDIDELAWKHVNRHPKDKSEHHLSLMRGRWGALRAKEAIERAEDVRAMVDPEFASRLPDIRRQRQYDAEYKAADIALSQARTIQKLRLKQERNLFKLARHRGR